MTATPKAGGTPAPVHAHPEKADGRNCPEERSRARDFLFRECGLGLLAEPFRLGSDRRIPRFVVGYLVHLVKQEGRFSRGEFHTKPSTQ